MFVNVHYRPMSLLTIELVTATALPGATAAETRTTRTVAR